MMVLLRADINIVVNKATYVFYGVLGMIMMNNEKKLWIAGKIDKVTYVVLLILALAVCVSEPLSRNVVRVLFILFFCRIAVLPPQKELLQKYKGFALVFIGFIFILIVSALYGGKFWSVVHDSEFVFNYNLLIPFIIALGITRERQLIWIVRCLMVSIVAVDLYIFWQFAHGITRPISFIRAAVMVTAMMYVILLPMLFTILMEWRRLSVRQIFSYGLVSLLTMIAFILNGTRGAWLAILLILPMMLLFYQISWKKIIALTGGTVLLIASTYVFFPVVHQRVQSVGDMQETSHAERLRMWRSAIHMGIDHPVLGVGLGNYGDQYQNHYIDPDAKEPDQRHAHNTFLQFFGENGIIGLAAYCMLLGYGLVWAWKRKSSPYACMLFLSTVALLIYSLTDYTYAGWPGMRLYWFFLGNCLKGVDFMQEPPNAI